jgi:general secretion pathway protein H
LLEVTIALLVVGLMVSLALPGVRALTGANLKSSAHRLATAIRYLYGYSVMHNEYCRIAFDLDASSYQAECTTDQFALAREKEKSIDGERMEEAEKEQEREDEEGFGLSEEEREAFRLKRKKALFAAHTDQLIRPETLPKDISLDGVWTGHQSERYTKGRAYLYFFPAGFVERSVIHLADQSGVVYSLDVQPLSGKVKVYPHFVEIPRD